LCLQAARTFKIALTEIAHVTQDPARQLQGGFWRLFLLCAGSLFTMREKVRAIGQIIPFRRKRQAPRFYGKAMLVVQADEQRSQVPTPEDLEVCGGRRQSWGK
jgi:hypothetical protein